MDHSVSGSRRRRTAVAALAALSALLNACAGGTHGAASDPELAHARTAYARMSADPLIASHGADALEAARQALERAGAADTSAEERSRLAVLAERRLELAQAQAREWQAKQEIAGLMRERITQSQQPGPVSQQQPEARRAHAQAQSARDAALAAQLAGQGPPPAAAVHASPAVQRLESELAALEVPTAETRRGLVLTLDDALQASPDKGLPPAIATKLAPLVEFLRTDVERQVIVEAYTDNQGPLTRNLQQSQATAEAIRAHLIRQGVSGARVLAYGFGPDQPAADDGSAAGRSRNPRVELIVTPASGADGASGTD